MQRGLVSWLLLLALCALPWRLAAQDLSGLSQALQLPKLAQLLHLEGVEYGATLEAEMFPGTGGERWASEVARIHDPARILGGLESALAPQFADHPDALAQSVAFFESELGQKIITLELSAREALLDDTTLEAAKVAFDDLRAKPSERLQSLEAFVEINDLIFSNIAGAMNANFAFMTGLRDGGAVDHSLPESDLMADLWSQEDQIRTDIEGWVFPYVALAYQPLNDEELAAYLQFSRTPAGKVVNSALFAAFDLLFAAVSYDLGLGVAEFLTAQDI